MKNEREKKDIFFCWRNPSESGKNETNCFCQKEEIGILLTMRKGKRERKFFASGKKGKKLSIITDEWTWKNDRPNKTIMKNKKYTKKKKAKIKRQKRDTILLCWESFCLVVSYTKKI